MGELKLDSLKRLIVIDDEVDMLNLYKHFFRHESSKGNFEVICFTSAKECLNYFELNLISFNTTLVISDINMPGMNGFELLAQIRILHPDVCVWMASAYSDDEVKKKALLSGAENYFEKPINFALLKAAIASKVK